MSSCKMLLMAIVLLPTMWLGVQPMLVHSIRVLCLGKRQDQRLMLEAIFEMAPGIAWALNPHVA